MSLENPATALVGRMRRTLVATLAPLLQGVPRVALLDFPGYSNAGDSAIWLGALRLLEECGVPPPVYVADRRSYDRGALAARLGGGAILITGGGNFGDLWESHQAFRERVARDFPDAPIIQLPQTIHFASDARLARAREALDSHPAFTILARDRRSLEAARSAFRARVLLCPDLAFAFGTLDRPRPPDRDLVWQSRRDQERPAAGSPAEMPGAPRPVDWARIRRSPASVAGRYMPRAVGRWPRALAPLERPLERLFRTLAERRLAAACRLLSGGRVVVTNRLHGHLLCLLLGIPHFVSDNRYGKLRSFHETWTAEAAGAVFCDSEAEALERARQHPALSGYPRGGTLGAS